MRICIVTTRNFTDKTWIKREASILRELGFDVSIIGLRDEKPSPLNIIEFRDIICKLRKCYIALIWFAHTSSILTCALLGLPLIVNCVGYEVTCYPGIVNGIPCNMFMRAVLGNTLKLADELIAISKESLQWCAKWSGRQGFVIYEGIDIDNYSCDNIPLKREGFPQIATVAALSIGNIIRKDLVTLIKAVYLLKKKYPHIKLYVIGPKHDGYKVLKAVVEKLNLRENVVFTGKVSHSKLLSILCSSDVFVMTSYHEGFPTAACEAAALGLPVIVSNRPAMNEVFNHNNAKIVEPGDPIRLARAIEDLVENYEKRKKIASNARREVRTNYSLNVRKKRLGLLLLLLLKKLKGNVKRYYTIRFRILLLYLALSLTTRFLKKIFDIFVPSN